MAVLAHPDDESLGAGGLFARYAGEGVETFLLTATRGQRGRFGAPGTPKPDPEEVGRVREGEARAAARVLGIGDVAFLDFMDGDLDRVAPAEAIAAIARHLRRARPHVVVTFAPDGGYGHPDHIAICQYATAATVAAADPALDEPAGSAPHAVSKLYYMVWGAEASERYQSRFKKLVLKVDGVERGAVAWPDWAVTTTIHAEEHWQTVWRAIQCHRTQLPGYPNLEQSTEADHRAMWGRTDLYRAFSLVNGGRTRETDLFEGLR